MIGQFGGWPATWLGVLLGGLVLAGCNKEPFDTVSVQGKVIYEDGSLIPAKRIRLEFIPQAAPIDPATHPRPGMVYVNVADGTFSDVTSHKYGDGVTVGKHKVAVISLDENEIETDQVPKEYRNPDTTPLEIEANGNMDDLVLKVKKP